MELVWFVFADALERLVAEPALEGLVAEGGELVSELVVVVVGVAALVVAGGERAAGRGGAARRGGAAGGGGAARRRRVEGFVHHVRRALCPVLL